MIVFQDEDLKNPNNLLSTHKIPLEIWHEVLEFFRDEGLIEQRWCLQIPMYLKRPDHYSNKPDWRPEDHMITPQHGPHGEEIEETKGGFFGTIGESTTWNPGLLTNTQKDLLMGKTYMRHRVKYARPDEDQSEHIVVSDKYLHRVFVRPRSILNQKTMEDSAKRLGAASVKDIVKKNAAQMRAELEVV